MRIHLASKSNPYWMVLLDDVTIFAAVAASDLLGHWPHGSKDASRPQVLDALAIIVLCPGAVFALAAGAIFSLAQGTALVWLGTSLGQTLAFMVGRCAHRAEVPGCGV